MAKETVGKVSHKTEKGFDGTEIYTTIWEPLVAPRGVILIIHGMVEHIGRYDYFAKKCNESGYVVFGFDLRAHGHTAGTPEKVGKYDGDLFGDCVQDAIFFADRLRERFNLPVVLLGHSYGSFVLQEVVQKDHNYAVAIFSGSANMKGQSSVSLGKTVAKITRCFKGKQAPAKMIYKLSFGAYGKGFEQNNWLTRDTQIFNKYNEDPFCGNVCSAQFYVSFFEHLSKLYNKQNLSQISRISPILITSGECDPVGGKNHKLVDKLDLLYRSYGLPVTYQLWEGARHEILNETNKDEIINWILDYIGFFIK